MTWMDAALKFMAEPHNQPDVILCSPIQYAAYEATLKFGDRDRRRLKREQNKAMRKAKEINR